MWDLNLGSERHEFSPYSYGNTKEANLSNSFTPTFIITVLVLPFDMMTCSFFVRTITPTPYRAARQLTGKHTPL